MDRERARVVVWAAAAVAVGAGVGAVAYRAWRGEQLPPPPGSVEAMTLLRPVDPPPVWPGWVLLGVCVAAALVAGGFALALWLNPDRALNRD